jgi:hypothetical protein
MKQKGRNWLFALALTIPMMIFFIGYLFNHTDSIQPTGFIQYDNVSYIAYAKQYLDTSASTVFYANPFTESGEYKPIYFQTQTVFFALLLKLGVPPGWILIPFTFICSLICFRLVISIYDHVIRNRKYRSITLWLFAWGGGMLTMGGFFAQLFSDHPAATNMFVLDPANGWWGLNLGRSLFFSCEAYYHALFLASTYFLLNQKWLFTLLFSVVLSASHPFTGIENLSIICLWVFTDRLIFKNKSIPNWFIVAEFTVLFLHLFYYLYYLNLFPDHQSVSEQYELNWRLRFFNMLPAYCIVGALALTRFIRSRSINAQTRLFFSWFLVAFCLANHELLINPVQPIHFTRGYIWTSLFLLGIPGLHLLFEALSSSRFRRIILLLFLALFFSDNLSWIGFSAFSKTKTVSTSYIHEEHHTVFNLLNNRITSQSLIIARDPVISYLSAVYTKGRPYYSHPYTTPHAAKKKASLELFMTQGIIDSSWKGRNVYFIFRKNDSLENRRSVSLNFQTTNIFETKSYKIIETEIPKSTY